MTVFFELLDIVESPPILSMAMVFTAQITDICFLALLLAALIFGVIVVFDRLTVEL